MCLVCTCTWARDRHIGFQPVKSITVFVEGSFLRCLYCRVLYDGAAFDLRPLYLPPSPEPVKPQTKARARNGRASASLADAEKPGCSKGILGLP